MRVRRHTASGAERRRPPPPTGAGGAADDRLSRLGRWLGGVGRGYDGRLLAGTFAGFLAVGYLISATVVFPAPFFTRDQTTPVLLGLTRAEAQAAVTEAGLVAGEISSDNHPTVERGHVVWQDPPAGVVIPEGSSVEFTLSQGPSQIPVPDVANYDVATAELLMRTAGLVPLADYVPTALPRGTVVNTRPATGSTLRPGSTVRLLVSEGPPTISVPDLAGLTPEQAAAALVAAGLRVGDFLPGISRAQAEGLIFSQDPAAGTLSAEGTVVTGFYVRARNP